MDSGAQSLSQLLGFCYGIGRYLNVFVSHGLVVGYLLLVISMKRFEIALRC
jgi:hypothetical protein